MHCRVHWIGTIERPCNGSCCKSVHADEVIVPIFFSALFGIGNIFCFSGICKWSISIDLGIQGLNNYNLQSPSLSNA